MYDLVRNKMEKPRVFFEPKCVEVSVHEGNFFSETCSHNESLWLTEHKDIYLQMNKYDLKSFCAAVQL